MAIFKKNLFGNWKRQEIEFEDIFLDKVIKDKTESMDVWERKLEVPLKKRAFWMLWASALAVVSVLVFYTFSLQIFSQKEYTAMADDNKFMVAYLSASRGIIYDTNLTPLVKNEASFDLWLKKSEMQNSASSIEFIAKVLGQNQSDLKQAIENEKSNDILIKKNLSHEQIISLEARQTEFSSYYIQKGILRVYEAEKALSPILGYLGKISPEELDKLEGYRLTDEVGKEGLEKYYESALKEKKGKYQVERNAKGEEISKQVTEYPKSGNSLVLSLDVELQNRITEVLKGVMADSGVKKSSVLAINPQNGEILASVSMPSFDNNLFSKGISYEDFKNLNENKLNPQLNRAVSGLYPTGSTIKPFIASAALEEKIITETTQLWCPLKMCLENKYSGGADCFVDNKFHGTSDVKRAIAESVNPFFYLIGGGYTAPKSSSQYYDPLLPKKLDGLGIGKIEKYLNLFGFGTTTGVDLPGELAGRVPNPDWKQSYFKNQADKLWFQGDTYNLSIGQGYLLSTPLQLANAISSIANNGKLIKPHFAKKILDPFGNTIQEFEPEIIRQNFITPNTLRIVREGMRQAVNSPQGSALSLNTLQARLAAKTGTAQIGKGDVYENWIAVFGPYENPNIVLLVLLEEVSGIQAAAQRTAREILDWYFLNHPVSTAQQ